MANVAENLANSVPSWGAKLVYGEKTTIDGTEVLPVSVVAFGFGGGEGSTEQPVGDGVVPAGTGSGGGGGGWAAPVGAYINGIDGVRFRPNPVALLVVASPVIAALGLALSRIIKASKK